MNGISIRQITLAFAISIMGLASAEEIVLGQSCALSGPTAALGRAMRDGIAAYLLKLQKEGGIRGKTVRLITKDDGYEPEKAIKNTRELIEEEKVFLLIGEVGTPTSNAVLGIAEEHKIPFFAPFTGAEGLRNPVKPHVIHLRASYYQEMEKLASYLVDKKKLTRIACFYQNDAYGQTGLAGIQKALARRKLELVATGNYERNTLGVKVAVLEIRKGNPEAIVMVGAYAPCAEFIKLAKRLGMKDTLFCNISFVGTEALKEALGEDGEGVIISQVVVFPWDQSIPLVREYTAGMTEYQKENPEATIGFVSLEGYMAAKLFHKIAEAVKGELTREAFLQTLHEVKEFDLGGIKLVYGPQDHQGLDEVFLTVIQGGAILPLTE